MSDRTVSISGQITIDGKPAAGLEAEFLPQHNDFRENAIATVKTDLGGRYHFAAVPAGHYWLKVHAPGYVNPVKWDDEGPGRNVLVADGQSVENADLDLVLGGIISGRIIDPDGQAVVGEYVQLTFADQRGPVAETLDLDEDEQFFTDSDGRYRICGIPSGRYVVSIGVDIAEVTGAARNAFTISRHSGQVDGDHFFEQAFYQGVRSRGSAKVIEISAGVEIHGVDMMVGRSYRAYAVRGRVLYAASREPVRHCYIQLGHYHSGGYGSTYCRDGLSDTDYDGNFRVEGLLPGRFFVSAQFEGETEFYCEPVEFDITNDDLIGLEIKALRGVTVSGSVTIDGPQNPEAAARLAELKLRAEPKGRDPRGNHDLNKLEIKALRGVPVGGFVTSDGPQNPEAAIRLVPLELPAEPRGLDARGHDSREAAVNSDGSFSVRGLRPGPVRLSLGFEGSRHYFSLVRIEYPGGGGELQTILGAPVINPWDAPPLLIGEQGLVGVRCVLQYKNGSIRGHVKIVRGKLDSDTRLLAGISKRTENGCWSTSREVDANGTFSMDGLEPGEYSISIGDGMEPFSETRTVTVNKDSESEISFAIDLSTTRKRD